MLLQFVKFLVLLLFAMLVTGSVMKANQRYGHEIQLSRQLSTNDDYFPSNYLNKREAPAHSAPYIVSIQLRTANGLVHYCAGSIINEHWILTAAHCLASDQAVRNSVLVAGCHNTAQQSSQTVQMRTIDNFVVHELYVGGIAPYDIAMLYTKTPFRWTPAIQPVTLPSREAIPTGRARLFGWGDISTTRDPMFPACLQTENMPIIDLALCEKVLGRMGLSLHPTNLCTGPLTGGKGICTSDSGGPLVQANKCTATTTLIGVVSWGKMPCGQANSPSVYVRVSAFIDWIEANLNSCLT